MTIVVQSKASFAQRGYVPERRYSIHRQKNCDNEDSGPHEKSHIIPGDAWG